MKNILAKILKILAKLTLKRYKPKIVAITGNVGKTSAKDAVYVVLKDRFKTRKSEKSFNNEIGVPVTILGIKSEGKNVFLWIFYFIVSVLKLIWTKYPKILILEYGVDKPGDIDYLLSIAKPDIAVVTAIGDIPAHIENFSSVSDIVKEKSKLPKSADKNSVVILNADYPSVLGMAQKTKAEVITYGFKNEANIKIYDPEFKFDEKEGVKTPSGISFKIEYKGSVVPVRINAYGIPNVYSATVAFAVGVSLGINLVDISESLQKYKAPKGRMNALEGAKNSVILDDTYNASPTSMIAGLETFKMFNGKRKIAVLGDMLEIGKYSEEAHRATGKLASSFCDLIITVGNKARFIADEAKKQGFFEGENLFSFNTSEELAEKIENIIQKGDSIFFKASQGIRLEKAIVNILKDPKKANELLPRQGKEWKR